MDSQKFLELYKTKGVAKKGTRARPWAGATGLYMVAPSCPANFYDGESCTNPVPKSVKIGKATGKGGLASRIDSYGTYWPHGTTVHAVMITPSYDEKYGTIRDYASARETTLKRILRRPEVDACSTKMLPPMLCALSQGKTIRPLKYQSIIHRKRDFV